MADWYSVLQHPPPSTSSPPIISSHSHSFSSKPEPSPALKFMTPAGTADSIAYPGLSGGVPSAAVASQVAPGPTSSIGSAAASGSTPYKRPPTAKRTFVSCDTCRRRKIKCVRPLFEGIEGQEQDQRCLHCRAQKTECQYLYQIKKPGPRHGSRKDRKEKEDVSSVLAAGEPGSSSMSQTHVASSSSAPRIRTASTSSSSRERSLSKSTPITSIAREALTQHPPVAASTSAYPFGDGPFDMPLIPDLQTDSAILGTYAPAVPLQSGLNSMPAAASLASDAGVHSLSDFQLMALNESEQDRSGKGLPAAAKVGPSQASLSPGISETSSTSGRVGALGTGSIGTGRTQSPSRHPRHHGPRLGKVFARPVESPRSIDDVVPRQTVLSIIALYFHHLYPLMPMVHKPSFAHDLVTRRDEKDPAFLAFVLSLTAYTIIQCPRSVIPAPWSFYRKLHQICHLTSRRMQPHRYDPPLLLHVCTLYADHIYLGSTSENNAANSLIGEAVRTAVTVGLHDERNLNLSYAPGLDMQGGPTSGPVPALGLGIAAPVSPPVDAIEHELRRRVYWLLVGSDTTIAVLQNEPIFLREFDTWGIGLPRAIDDEFLTSSGSFGQPEDRGPSILCGFETVSRLHQLLRELLEAYRQDRRYPPSTSSGLRKRLAYVSAALQRIKGVLNDMPKALQAPSEDPHNLPARAAGELPDLGVSTRYPHTSGAPNPHSPGAPLWPRDMFDSNGLPNADAHSNPSASTSASPHSSHSTLAPFTSTVPVHGANGGGESTDSAVGIPPSWDQLNAAVLQVDAFRVSPPPLAPSQPPILSAFATMRANILVTEAMIRFVLVEYRDLVESLLANGPNGDGAGLKGEHARPPYIDADTTGGAEADDEWEAASKEMLDAFSHMPLESLAANGQSMIAKIFYLVSALLNRTQSNTRGHQYLCDFLALLSKLSADRVATQGDASSSTEDEHAPDLDEVMVGL